MKKHHCRIFKGEIPVKISMSWPFIVSKQFTSTA